MNFFIQRSELRDIYDKVAAGERISEADALRLFESKDLNAVGAIADFARQKKVGNRASYIVNRYIPGFGDLQERNDAVPASAAQSER